MTMWPFDRKDDKPPQKKTPHHYVLAHVALRQIALGDPYGFFAVMSSPQRQKFLDDLWKQICENCDKEGSACFTPKDVSVHCTRVGDFPTVLLVMPKAHFTTEAHMVCTVLKVPTDDMELRPDNPEIRYFTIEKGIKCETGVERTVLCEWREGTHINYGNGPEATSASFMTKIQEMI